MMTILRGAAGHIRRNSSSGAPSKYPIWTLAEMKACGYTTGGGLMRALTISTSETVPAMRNLYARDVDCWNGTWPGTWDWGGTPVTTLNYAQDSGLHSHGYGSMMSQSSVILSQFFREYSMPTGICNPPAAVRMFLGHCGGGIYNNCPSIPTSGLFVGDAAFWGGGGLEMHFWSQTGSGYCTYVLTVMELAALNQAAGNTLGLNGYWAVWSGGVYTLNLPLVAALFSQGNGVVCARFRWIWSAGDPITPSCTYCNVGGTQPYSSPNTVTRYMNSPYMFVWG